MDYSGFTAGYFAAIRDIKVHIENGVYDDDAAGALDMFVKENGLPELEWEWFSERK